ncbi:MAG: hypothetical protein ACPG6T_03925 [Paracoccaceae bacterium]
MNSKLPKEEAFSPQGIGAAGMTEIPMTKQSELVEGVGYFFAESDKSEAQDVLDLALKLALERGGQTLPVSSYDIDMAKEKITGIVNETARLEKANRKAAQTITDQAALIDELVGALKPFIGDPATFPTMELMQTTHGRNVLTKVEQWKAG